MNSDNSFDNKSIEIEKKYLKMYNDIEIRNIYNNIENNFDLNSSWAHHCFSHIESVIDLMEKILRILNIDNTTITKGKIAALLHDVGCTEGKENHAYRSYEFAKDYFKRNNFELEDENLILEAIKNHSSGFETDNILQLALILSDKLDIKFTRPTKLGLEIEGNRQFQYVNDIDVKMDNNVLKFYFTCSDNMNRKELEEYYFMSKIINSVKSFTNKFNLKYDVFINNEKWQIFYK